MNERRCPEIHPEHKVECRVMAGTNHEFHTGGPRGSIEWPNEDWKDPTRRVVIDPDRRKMEIASKTEGETHAGTWDQPDYKALDAAGKATYKGLWIARAIPVFYRVCTLRKVVQTTHVWPELVWPPDGRWLGRVVTEALGKGWIRPILDVDGNEVGTRTRGIVTYSLDGQPVQQNKIEPHYESLIYKGSSEEISSRVLSNMP